MSVSSSLRKSRSFSPEPEIVAATTPTLIHLEEVRRRDERERQRIARDYARLREEQTGRGGSWAERNARNFPQAYCNANRVGSARWVSVRVRLLSNALYQRQQLSKTTQQPASKDAGAVA
jgi:hypothetical protein